MYLFSALKYIFIEVSLQYVTAGRIQKFMEKAQSSTIMERKYSLSMAKKLNVLMISPRFFPSAGGIQTHIYEVGRRLVTKGVNVTVLTTLIQDEATGPSGVELPEEEIFEGMRIIRVPIWPRHSDYCIAPKITHYIKSEQWDVIHVQGCNTFVPPIAMLAARKAKIPYILTFHTGGHSSAWRNNIRAFQWQMLRPLLSQAVKLVGVSRFEAEFFRDTLHLPDKQFTVIPNGAVTTSISHNIIEKPDSTLIISAGRLERYKGHQRLITALPSIREQRPDARLLILGKGPYEANLRQLAQQIGIAEHVDIRFIPASNRHEMLELLSQASLLALLSDYEAQGIAVMEALALRRPVLVADTSGLREIAQQGWARSIPLNSTPVEIAHAALQQIENPLIPPDGLVLPTWENCAQQLLNEYEAIAGKTGTATSTNPSVVV
jgi:glycosyltransferase involved in cell wall biosynthesis